MIFTMLRTKKHFSALLKAWPQVDSALQPRVTVSKPLLVTRFASHMSPSPHCAVNVPCQSPTALAVSTKLPPLAPTAAPKPTAPTCMGPSDPASGSSVAVYASRTDAYDGIAPTALLFVLHACYTKRERERERVRERE